MFLKITTCCAFVGTESTHIVEIDDNLTEDEIQEIVDDYIQKKTGLRPTQAEREDQMTSTPKVTTGTYNGKPFKLIERMIHFGGSKSTRQIKSYLLRLENGDVEYVLDYDPLLKFDPSRTEK